MEDLLAVMPDLVRQVVHAMPADQAKLRPMAGGFSLHEHVWHLADLEEHGFAERIRRLLAEDHPLLPDFDGERWAHERVYHALDLEQGLRLFAANRAQNLARFAALSEAERARSGEQEGVGRVRLDDLPKRMADHDRAHSQELADLLGEIAPGHPLRAELSRVAQSGPRSRAA